MEIVRHPVFRKSVRELIIDILVYGVGNLNETGGTRVHVSENAKILGWKWNKRAPTRLKAQQAQYRLKCQNQMMGEGNKRIHVDTAITMLPNISSVRVSYDLGQGCYRSSPFS